MAVHRLDLPPDHLGSVNAYTQDYLRENLSQEDYIQLGYWLQGIVTRVRNEATGELMVPCWEYDRWAQGKV